MILSLPQQRHPSVFRDDELVFQGRPLLPAAEGAVFGATDVWDCNGVLKRPANVSASGWKLCFSKELEDTYWNLLAREAVMARLQPGHLALRKAGVALPAAADPQTMINMLSRLRVLARWAIKNGLPIRPDEWTQDDLRHHIRHLVETGSPVSTIVSHVSFLRAMADIEPVLSLTWPTGYPWPGQSARSVAKSLTKSEIRPPGDLATPVVPPEVWFPLVRAAWAYLHDFAADILRADQRLRDLRAAAVPSSAGIETRLQEWLADPRNNVPVHVPGVGSSAPEVNWRLLTLLLGSDEQSDSCFKSDRPLTARMRELVESAVAAGRITTHALTGEPVQVTRPDGSTGPWHPGIDPSNLVVLKTVLRNAAFCLVVALSMMRDSEIHEIPRGAVVEHYSTPAIASTKIKGTSDRAGKRWWIADPVAEALSVAEAVSLHPERAFAPVHTTKQDGTIDGVKMLESFVAAVNAGRTWSGVDKVPTAYIRPHMFRHTMAMLTDQFPGSEIATGIQLKHIGTRALANASTRGYAAADDRWAKHLGTALDNVKFRKIRELYQQHTAGQEIGFGGGAERVKAVFDEIAATVKARNGDERTADTLLRTQQIHIRFGVLNHCTADHTNPIGAVCLEKARIPEGHVGPLHERCRPDRCGNSLIAPAHLPIYESHERKQLQIIDNPRTLPFRRELAERELETTAAVLAVAKAAHR